MLIINMLDVSPQQAQVIMVAKATLPSTKELYGTIGACLVIEKSKETNLENKNASGHGIGVRGIAWNVFTLKDPEYVDYGGRTLSDLVHKNSIDKGTPDYFAINAESATVKVLESPKHGSLSKDLTKEISYYPNSGYVGTDKAIFLVDMVGYNMKVVYYFKVADVDLEKGDIQKIWNKYCPKDNWLISNFANPIISLNTAASLTDSIYSLSLTTAFFGVDPTSLTFANYVGAAVGETKGENDVTTITLDTNAGGHGWIIDYTPYLNEEFPPISNFNEWVTKADNSDVGYKY